MKKFNFSTSVIFFALFAFAGFGVYDADAQILKKIKKSAENAATRKVQNKTVKETNKAMDDVLDGDNNNSNSNDNSNNNTNTNPGNSRSDTTGISPTSEKEQITIYSKSDWVAAEDLILYEDFSKDAVGDFPQLWNTNSSGEIITLSNKPDVKWLKMYNRATYQPDLPRELPKDFTIEFDVIAHGVSKATTSQTARLTVMLGDGKTALKEGASHVYTFLPVFQGWVQPIQSGSRQANKELASGRVEKDLRLPFLNGCHVAISGKDQRYCLYVDGQKIVDMPRGMPADKEIKTLLFSTYGLNNESEHIVITNLRIAEGLPEPRAKLFSTGKYVTNAILFDVNSAEIKPESFGILREIGEALKTESSKKVKIIGHTDADGSDDFNMDLSKKRATSVKDALVNNFGVAEAQLTTDGKGESDPVASNDTVLDKAKNRRTEFVLM